MTLRNIMVIYDPQIKCVIYDPQIEGIGSFYWTDSHQAGTFTCSSPSRHRILNFLTDTGGRKLM